MACLWIGAAHWRREPAAPLDAVGDRDPLSAGTVGDAAAWGGKGGGGKGGEPVLSPLGRSSSGRPMFRRGVAKHTRFLLFTAIERN